MSKDRRLKRLLKRKQIKKQKIELRAKTRYFTLDDIQRAIHIAVEMKKLTKGHLFSKNLKDRCVFCGLTMKTKKECQYWAMTLIDRIQTILINPDFYTDDNLQALWLQHGEEYQNIKLPLATGAKPNGKS